MNCNCGNWNDETLCKIHNPKLPQPELSCHHTYVIHVYRRYSNRKWFFTMAKDAIQISASEDFEKKPVITVNKL